jgi:hypothetical protein
MNQKYVRIQARYTGKTGKTVGFIGANWHILRAGRFSQEDKELFLQTEEWFNENLPNPPFYNDNPELNNPQKAITYFKTDMISRFEEKVLVLTGLLDKYGVHYDVVFTNYIGEIIYEDDYQVAVI